MPDTRTDLAARFAAAGFSAAQNSLADIALDWFRAYLERPEVVERAAAAVFNEFYGGSSGLDDMAAGIAQDHARAALSSILESTP